jgi:hypothetical protein
MARARTSGYGRCHETVAFVRARSRKNIQARKTRHVIETREQKGDFVEPSNASSEVALFSTKPASGLIRPCPEAT